GFEQAVSNCEYAQIIKWDVKTKSVIYGKETSLTCNGQTCSPHSNPPYLEKDDIVTKESKVQVDILMQVFPLPTCVISYQESVMPLNISDYATTYEHGDYFKIFEVRIYQIYEIDHLSCKGSLNLSCTVGSHNYTPIKTKINFCTEGMVFQMQEVNFISKYIYK
ncbi:hypothetical protein AM593_04398, partial [Mytilus galloprovincialis]